MNQSKALFAILRSFVDDCGEIMLSSCKNTHFIKSLMAFKFFFSKYQWNPSFVLMYFLPEGKSWRWLVIVRSA
jgi:hypothetical protein